MLPPMKSFCSFFRIIRFFFFLTREKNPTTTKPTSIMSRKVRLKFAEREILTRKLLEEQGSMAV